MYLCQCQCGVQKIIGSRYLRDGRSRSCGCLQVEQISKRSTTHGGTKNNKISSEYVAWRNMKARCYRPEVKEYKNYGGRGIKICNRWLLSFESFYQDMGKKPTSKHSIDRIDVNGNYEPKNCRWATRKEQSRGLRKNVWFIVNGVPVIQKELSKMVGVSEPTIMKKLKDGMPKESVVKYYNLK